MMYPDDRLWLVLFGIILFFFWLYEGPELVRRKIYGIRCWISGKWRAYRKGL